MVKIDLSDITPQLIKEEEAIMERVLDEGIIILKGFTPEDTFELTSSYRVEIENKPDRIEGRIFVDPNSEAITYVDPVEFGNGTVKNYYKNAGRRNGGTPFLTGVGARMFTKTEFEILERINQL